MTKNKSIGIMLPIEFKRGKDKKKRKKRSNRKEAIIAAASIGGGARIGGIHGFIRGRGGLGGSKTIAERNARVWTRQYPDIYNSKESKKEFIKSFAKTTSGPSGALKGIGEDLNKRGRKMAIKHAAIGAGIGATAYGGYRAIKALRNRKNKK